jgi:tetratricopeptide (TPR) repeat protein
MFKLFKNLFLTESTQDSESAIAISQSDKLSWESKIAEADSLWEQGKLNEALSIYGLTIEKNPSVLEIQQRLAGRLKQQGDLAVAYEKLAIGLKNKGKIEQAANYYRQAIHLKAITGNTKQQLFRGSVSPAKKPPIPLASLKEAAFSFQPLVSANSQLVKVSSPQISWSNLETESEDTSPSFPSRIKAVNPQQARDIDWETAQVYLQKALDHTETKEWEQSALACKKATTILPDMAEAYKVWGNALQRMGNTAEAMSCYAKAVEIKPNLAEVYAGLADIYAEQDKLQQAVKHYQKALIIKPSSKTYRSLAQVWHKLGDLEQTQVNIAKALELESSKTENSVDSTIVAREQSQSIRSVEIYCNMARQLEQQNDWKQAALYYRKALDLSMALPALTPQKTDSSAVKLNLAQTKSQPIIKGSLLQQPKAVETQLDKAIQRYYKQSKLQPNSPKIQTDLGNLYSRKRKWQYAIACYRQAINLKPRYANAHLNYARILFKIGKRQEFIQEMQLALSIEPKIGSALDRFYLGNALVEEDQQQQAIGFYYKAIALNPKFVQAYHRVGEVLSQQGKHEQAIKFLKHGISQNPNDAESFYLLGQQFEFLHNWDNAVKMYSKLLQLEPQFPGASQKLNRALAEKLKLSH